MMAITATRSRSSSSRPHIRHRGTPCQESPTRIVGVLATHEASSFAANKGHWAMSIDLEQRTCANQAEFFPQADELQRPKPAKVVARQPRHLARIIAAPASAINVAIVVPTSSLPAATSNSQRSAWQRSPSRQFRKRQVHPSRDCPPYPGNAFRHRAIIRHLTIMRPGFGVARPTRSRSPETARCGSTH
jgi:hypothetical protein